LVESSKRFQDGGACGSLSVDDVMRKVQLIPFHAAMIVLLLNRGSQHLDNFDVIKNTRVTA
jgi:hypothetical protein